MPFSHPKGSGVRSSSGPPKMEIAAVKTAAISRLTTEIPQTDFCFDHRKGIPCFKGMPFLLVYSPAKFEVIPLLVPPVLGCLGILSPQFRPDLIVVPLHRGAVHLQFPGDQGLAGHAGVLPQVGGDGLLLGTYPVGVFRACP